MKYYVVWYGLAPGVYDSWEECQQQITGVKGARYKSFPTLEAAVEAFRGSDQENEAILRQIAAHQLQQAAEAGAPVRGWAVDGGCSRNPGPMYYQGVDLATRNKVFAFGPLDGGTNNIAEYLAIIHALALLTQRGDTSMPVYSDSATALSWVTRRRCHVSKIPRTPATAKVWELLDRADLWLATHVVQNPIYKWDTEQWGEIPADFGLK